MAITKNTCLRVACLFPVISLLVFVCHGYAIDLSDEEKEFLRTKGTLTFVSQTRYPPFEFIDENDQHEGMMLDVVRWMAVELGFQPVFMDMTFQRAQEAVLSGKADILTSLFLSDRRKERFEFTDVLYDVPASIFVKAERTDIQDMTDLSGKTIAIQKGDYAKEFLESQNIHFDVLDTEDFSKATDMVIAGKADAVIGDEQIVLYHIFHNRLTAYVKKIGKPLYIGRNCMASNRSNVMLIGILNKGILEAGKSGVLRKVSEKWLGTQFSPRESFLDRHFWPLSLVAGGVLVLSLWVWAWNVSLRSLVRKKTEVIVSGEEALRESQEALSQSHGELQESVRLLEQSRSTLQLIIESIPVRVFWKDRDLRYLGCNTLFAQDAGLSRPDQLIGLDDFVMGWRDQADLYREDDRQVMESGVPKMNIVEPQTTPSGSRIWLKTCKVPLRLPEGGLLGVLGVYEDITERRQTAEALSLRESYLTAIIENQPGLLWLKDSEGRFLSVNHAFARSCGRRSPEEVIGKTDLDIWPKDLAEKYRADDREVMAGHTPLAVEEPIADQGDVKWFQTFKTPVFTPDERVLGTCGFALDVTERKQGEEERRNLEDRLQRAEKMEALGTLAGGVAHDLNNLLGIVVGYSELLLDDLEDPSPTRSEAMQILKGGQRAAAIVQDLLTLARRGIQDRQPLSLNEAILDCQKSPEFAGLVTYHPNIAIRSELGEDVLNISGSSVHLEKAFLNLISNAAEAMPDGGALTIRTRNEYLDRPVSGYDEVEEGDYVVLSVSDTGAGIPAGDLKRIFEPFYTKKVMGRSGTGLGLAVVWGTVKDHHGYVNVESEVGKGSTFTLYFPITREVVTSEEVSVLAAEYMGNGETIVVVDDVQQQRELAAKMLTKLHYTVTTVSSGEDAVDYLRQQPVDLVVLDMIMDPGMDGLDTYTSILELHPLQKAIIVSGFSETERVSRAQALGAGAYVKKPYVLETLGMAVRKELDRRD
ncbi:MAG: transporter substrate-binding domain-containing protein [Syntrophobacteraceae bacterium]